MSWNWAVVAACLIPHIGGWVNAIRNRDSINGWYKSLKKPSWTPPNSVCMSVWTCLYTAIGYASYLVWRDAGKSFTGAATLPLALYATQLTLDWAWLEIFFGRHNLKWSFYTILLMDVAVIACELVFWKVNHVASFLMVPYLGWLLIVTVLNHCIYRDNPVQVVWKK